MHDRSKNACCKLCYCEQGVFWIEPYLQLGRDPDFYELVWVSPLGPRHWRIEWKGSKTSSWQFLKIKRSLKLKQHGLKLKQLLARIPRSKSKSEYLLSVHGCEVFSAEIQPATNKVAIFGDFADGNPAALATAKQLLAQNPSLLVIPGDVAYEHGRLSEYKRSYFPVLNSEDRKAGVPLLRSVPSVACPGNHDVGIPKAWKGSEQENSEDLFAFFKLWRNPGGGPGLSSAKLKRMLAGRSKAQTLLEQIGPSFADKANFSFSWEKQRWVLLDANPYMDWSDSKLRKWLRRSLQDKDCNFKFVAFHQAAFNSDAKYASEQHMRLIFDILQEEGTDVVFSGHCHFYERHRPLRFSPSALKVDTGGTVKGDCFLDLDFDGQLKRRPSGPIQIVSGAASSLVSPLPAGHQPCPSSIKLLSTQNSFTILETYGLQAEISQLDQSGKLLDRIFIDKNQS